MPRVQFDVLPDDARLWVFGAERPLDGEEERLLLADVDAFLGGWKAHGAPLTSARQWLHDRFLLVGVDERTAPPSGCSIDAMTHVLEALERKLRVRLLDHAGVWYRTGEVVQRVERAAFRSLAQEGEVGPDTTVFDNTVTRVGQLRAGQWERPARESWHGRAFLPK